MKIWKTSREVLVSNDMDREQGTEGWPRNHTTTRREAVRWETAWDTPPKLMKTPLRTVFFLKDHQADSKEIREAEQTNCQSGWQSRMAAFLGPARLPSTLLSPCMRVQLPLIFLTLH